MPFLSLTRLPSASALEYVSYGCLYIFFAWRLVHIIDAHLHRPVSSELAI